MKKTYGAKGYGEKRIKGIFYGAENKGTLRGVHKRKPASVAK
jgi:hypothetical protein